ncbi:ATP-binding protein [Streptomyces sp. NBC_01808]|uniref:ATP-binding protein n=1 Tax=Streptomyces sp. NBC_01808 TaxID=2975947 RepID=UPI002DD80E3B|nr:ATP-binding protein [Streptomyces sp. NBC_01808]WSA40076.1 ATP-binding protein [Streptomyces sp. NBC_01808]
MKVTADNAEGHSARAWRLTAEARTIERWRNAAAAATADFGGDADAVAVVRLGVSELLANVAEHAGNKTCRLTVRVDEGWVYIHVYDTSRQAPALTTPSWDAESGRGLWLLNSMVADWGYECREDGKAVWFRAPLTAAAQERKPAPVRAAGARRVDFATVAVDDNVIYLGQRRRIAALVQTRTGYVVQFADATALHVVCPPDVCEIDGCTVRLDDIADGACFWCGTARRLVSVGRYATASGTTHTVYACTGCIAARGLIPLASRGDVDTRIRYRSRSAH